MIIGVGTDLVEVARIDRSYRRFGQRFAEKVLANTEMKRFLEHPSAEFLAKRFAAKEAVAKALGTGMRLGIHFPLIEVAHESSGKPVVVLHGAAKQRSADLGVSNWHLSISDERSHALAFVIAEG